MVWADMPLVGRTCLYVFARGGITETRHHCDILESIVRPYTGAICDAFILMEDNARAHTVRVSMTFLDDKGINVMNWLVGSADLNPIDHTCAILSRCIIQRPHYPDNLHNPIDVPVHKWQIVPQKGIMSMPRRCQECVDDRGDHTSFC